MEGPCLVLLSLVLDEHDTEIFVSKRSNTGVARDAHYYMSHGFGVD